jgi:sterol desaturase/sphingolipid hydroxylase (fatty acid hydroxylase superfamily)
MRGVVMLALVAAIVLLVALEFRDGQFARSWYQDRARLRRNLWYLAASLLVMPLLPVMNGQVRRYAPGLLDWGGPGALEVVCCFLVAELLGWLLHYVKHRNRFLWGFHFQHHREEQFNVWLTAHTHALEVAVSAALIALATCLLGFSEPAIEAYLVFYSFAKVYQHSAVRYRLGPLDSLVVGPAYHRLHHHAGSRCNYGVSLTVFDVLFGTARWPAARPDAGEARYGISGADGLPFGFWKEMGYFLKRGAAKSAGPAVRPGTAGGGPARSPAEESRP